MTSVERIFHYARHLPGEEEETDGDGSRALAVKTSPNWRGKGGITVCILIALPHALEEPEARIPCSGSRVALLPVTGLCPPLSHPALTPF